MDIPAFLNGVTWEPVAAIPERVDDLPYVTHSGVLEVFGHKLKCFRLSDGKAVFDQEDFLKFMSECFTHDSR